MARRVYTDADKAKVWVAYQAVQTVKGAARETGVPIQTVRDWVRGWERDGTPPDVQAVVPAARADFVENATRVRDLALERLEQQIDQGVVKGKDLVVTVGVLTDKVRLVEGKPTSRTEQVGAGTLPVEEVRELFAGFVKGIVEAAHTRDSAISSATEEEPIDAEWSTITAGELTAG